MRGKLALVSAAIALGGCASAKEIYTPDGRKGYTVQCPSAGGIQNDWGKCFAKAGEICGARGYDILERSSDGSIDRQAFGSGKGEAVTGQTRVMVIQCKGDGPSLAGPAKQ